MHRGCRIQIYNHDFNLARFLPNRNTHTREKSAMCVKDSVESQKKTPFFLELCLNCIFCWTGCANLSAPACSTWCLQPRINSPLRNRILQSQKWAPLVEDNEREWISIVGMMQLNNHYAARTLCLKSRSKSPSVLARCRSLIRDPSFEEILFLLPLPTKSPWEGVGLRR